MAKKQFGGRRQLLAVTVVPPLFLHSYILFILMNLNIPKENLGTLL